MVFTQKTPSGRHRSAGVARVVMSCQHSRWQRSPAYALPADTLQICVTPQPPYFERTCDNNAPQCANIIIGRTC